MNEIHRRTALSALGLTAMAAAAKAGPLNPPPGDVAPTGRTNDEIYNKIPAPGASDGRTPIAGGNNLGIIAINQPGSYVLTGPIVVNAAAIFGILINSPDVTLDLNGYSITCSSSGTVAISIQNNCNRVTVRNGRTVGGFAGITTGVALRNVVLEDLSVSGTRGTGIFFDSSVGVVRRCTLYDIGVASASTDGFTVAGFSLTGSGSRLEDCSAFNVVHNAAGQSVRAYTITGDWVISNCIAYNFSVPPAPTTGIFCNSPASIRRNCRSVNFTNAYVGGTDAGGNF
jgi:hypothetical protein